MLEQLKERFAAEGLNEEDGQIAFEQAGTDNSGKPIVRVKITPQKDDDAAVAVK